MSNASNASKIPLRAITVCVDYHDLLAVTVPYNRHHFQDQLVVTSRRDTRTHRLCHELGVRVHETDAFYANGAVFNKWVALEEGLDAFGRHGWLCLLDADVLWPKCGVEKHLEDVKIGKLYTPRRRMYPLLPRGADSIPPETQWRNYPIHQNDNEFAGYSQIFHATDPHLGPVPWHETNWKHAGGADSFFQLKWQPKDKVRPAFEVLHLGEAGANWMGRATPYADGTDPEGSDVRKRAMKEMFVKRFNRKGTGRFDGEKLS